MTATHSPGARTKVAIAVMVEYGGSGGTVAGKIGKGVVDALIHEQYLVPQIPQPNVAQTAAR